MERLERYLFGIILPPSLPYYIGFEPATSTVLAQPTEKIFMLKYLASMNTSANDYKRYILSVNRVLTMTDVV